MQFGISEQGADYYSFCDQSGKRRQCVQLAGNALVLDARPNLRTPYRKRGKPRLAAHCAGMKSSLLSALFLFGSWSGSLAYAQEVQSGPAMTARDIAKEALNPFAVSFKVPIESVTGFRVGPDRKTGESVNIEPLLPFAATPEWNVIVEPLLAMTSLPNPDATTGFDDIQTSVFLTPTQTSSWVWGLGPIVELPTASDEELGTGKWSAGPTGAVVYSNGPWLNCVLASHLASFAGDQHRAHVSLTSVEPQVSYTFENGWSVQTSPTISYDWTADAWTIPLGADVGSAFTLGSLAMSVLVGAYDLVKRPSGAPASIVRVQVTVMFPSGER